MFVIKAHKASALWAFFSSFSVLPRPLRLSIRASVNAGNSRVADQRTYVAIGISVADDVRAHHLKQSGHAGIVSDQCAISVSDPNQFNEGV